ncbi:substrate-binding domain-containing protein [Auraticoccus sp. F435]|uniref:Substrate-binding domain-containing protein n=1 Tax=Auraticoccus cholistanensis TaxID=2656650 RepID=A0A6A9UTG1_9ACTN|nr:LacI family DNA-binding transcriptional regulator [Auraticoccus cholistanensis]MVA76113.1 substrate-binding domain-containing protein [Auraticoccus cholistanensis]
MASRRPGGGPTMHDVAAAAAVSHQTVSRVVNQQPSVRPETRQKVLAEIERLGYRRNRAARTLVTRRSRTIGVLAPEVTQYGATSSVQAVEASARAAGYFALSTTAAVDRASTLAALDLLLDQGVDGLVVIAPHPEIEAAVSQRRVELPVVALQSVSAGRAEWVGVDQQLGARLVCEYLLQLGHRRVAHVSGPPGYFESDARRRGWAEALTAAGLEPATVVAGDWTAERGHAAAAELPPDVTAVFCANDQTALGVLAGLREAGRRVPEDVSVAGFDDLPESAFAAPPLTTVRQDFRQVGERAVARLLARLDGAAAGDDTVLRPELVVRRSTGPVRVEDLHPTG